MPITPHVGSESEPRVARSSDLFGAWRQVVLKIIIIIIIFPPRLQMSQILILCEN